MDYAIKYSKIRISNNTYILIPLGLVEGLKINDKFNSDLKYNTTDTLESFSSSEIVVDSIKSEEELVSHYNLDDIEFLKTFYEEEEKDYILVFKVINGELLKRKIKVSALTTSKEKTIFESIDGITSVTLNEGALNSLLSLEDIKLLKDQLERYKRQIETLKKEQEKRGLTKVEVEDGKITSITVDQKKYNPQKKTLSEQQSSEQIKEQTGDISVVGLERYLKERIFGHSEELKKIATILTLNHTADIRDGTESIIIPGPTGTGKTATFKCASEYLNVPFAIVNTVNLVPEGYRGTSIEDVLYSLLVTSNNHQDIAERSIIIFDEFDKMGESSLDIKEALKNIFLKFAEGSKFLMEKEFVQYEFDTTMSSKIYLGAFMDLFHPPKRIGFANEDQTETKPFETSDLYKKGYFKKELSDRITTHVIPYYELDNDTKLRIILESKLSVFLRKKERLRRQFGIETEGDLSYAKGIIDLLSSEDKSLRDVNNIIYQSLINAEYEILSKPGHYKKLTLTKDLASDPNKFDLN